MELKVETKKFKDLKDGDIFYLDLNPNYNNFIGIDSDLTGTDMIFIKDDNGYIEDEDNKLTSVLVNGGFNVFEEPDKEVIVIGHYSQLLKIKNKSTP